MPSLAAAVKGPLHQYATERTVGEHPAILAGKRYTLCYRLIDDPRAALGQPVDIRFSGAEVPTFLRVHEQAEHAVAVIAIIFGGVDTPLCGNTVGATRTILKAVAVYIVAHRGK